MHYTFVHVYLFYIHITLVLHSHTHTHSQEVLGNWEIPIMNDTYVMVFFGLLKSLVAKWLSSDATVVSSYTCTPCTMYSVHNAYVQLMQAQSLQNDLLCGQGLPSTIHFVCNVYTMYVYYIHVHVHVNV